MINAQRAREDRMNNRGEVLLAYSLNKLRVNLKKKQRPYSA
jgi:hypothetical protein